jgi:DNA primase large subunit
MESLSKKELVDIAKKYQLRGYSKLNKPQLIEFIREKGGSELMQKLNIPVIKPPTTTISELTESIEELSVKTKRTKPLVVPKKENFLC